MKSISYSQFTTRYNILRKIGSGSFGEVFLIEQNLTKRRFAFKKVWIKKIEKFAQYLRQIELQNFLAHPLVPKIFEFYVFRAQNHHLSRKPQIGIIMELGNCSLYQLIKDKNQRFSTEEIIHFAHRFIRLFAYFQDQNIVHRDIKPDNFIRFGTGLECKLIDFGLCSHVNDIKCIAGSFHYFSPKLKKLHYNHNLPIRTNPYKDDVYSFGLTLYEIITRQINQNLIKKSNTQYSKNVFHHTKNTQLTDLIDCMLQDDQDKRPDFVQLYQIFNKKILQYEQQKNRRNVQSNQFQSQKMSLYQPFANNQNDWCLTKKKYDQLDSSSRYHHNFEQIRKTYKQEYLNEEYEHNTIKDYEKQNNDNFYNNIEQPYERQNLRSPQKNQEYNMYKHRMCEELIETQNPRKYRKFQDEIQIQPQQIEIQQIENVLYQQPQVINYQKKKFHLGPKINITSIIIMKEIIISGCKDGSLYIVNTQSRDKKNAYRIEGMAHQHKSAITAMAKDKKGNLWTCSSNGQILVWGRAQFFLHLLSINHYHQQTIECTDKRGQKYTKIHNYVQMDSQANYPIQLPFNPPSGINCLYPIDQKNYIIGFNDGSVYIFLDDLQLQIGHKYHQKKVTSILIYENYIFTSSIDGLIVPFDLQNKLIPSNTFESQLPIIDFKIQGDPQNPTFFIVTEDGRAYQPTGWMIKVDQENDLNPLSIVASIFVNDFVFYIDRNGSFYRSGKLIQKFQGEGWNCMNWNGDKMMVMGNNKGDIVMLSNI